MKKQEEEKKPAIYTNEEWAAILRYRKTGVPNFGKYENLDFNNVGGEKTKEKKK